MKLKERLASLRSRLAEEGFADPALEARWLLAEALKIDLARLLLHSERLLSPEELARLEVWEKRRALGEPLAYITGHRGFYKWDFQVTPGVLIPRPETEHLVEEALGIFGDEPPAEFIELGVGSGCLVISLLKEWPEARAVAFDISPPALSLSARNAQQHNVAQRLNLQLEDASQGLKAHPQKVALVVANPPYIALEDTAIDPIVKKFEPHEALFADNGGLALIENWTRAVADQLAPGGFWIFEFGAGQAEKVSAIINQSGLRQMHLVRDLAGHERVAVAQKPQRPS